MAIIEICEIINTFSLIFIMSKCRSMYAGSSGAAYNVNGMHPGNGNNKWQGLVSTTNMRSSIIPYVRTRADGDNRNVVFCMNQLGGIGRKSTMFATTADGVKLPCQGSSISTNNSNDGKKNLDLWLNGVTFYNNLQEMAESTNGDADALNECVTPPSQTFLTVGLPYDVYLTAKSANINPTTLSSDGRWLRFYSDDLTFEVLNAEVNDNSETYTIISIDNPDSLNNFLELVSDQLYLIVNGAGTPPLIARFIYNFSNPPTQLMNFVSTFYVEMGTYSDVSTGNDSTITPFIYQLDSMMSDIGFSFAYTGGPPAGFGQLRAYYSNTHGSDLQIDIDEEHLYYVKETGQVVMIGGLGRGYATVPEHLPNMTEINNFYDNVATSSFVKSYTVGE